MVTIRIEFDEKFFNEKMDKQLYKYYFDNALNYFRKNEIK